MNRATVVLKNASGGIFRGKTVTMYMHKDYTHSDSNYNNLAQIDGTLVIDLNGKTLTHAKNYLFDAWAKGMSDPNKVFFLPDTKIEIKNGTVIMNSDIVRISGTGTSTNFAYEGNKNYSFTFTGVTFNTADNFTDKSIAFVNSFDNNNGKKTLTFKASFDGCTFNTASSTLLNFALNDSVISEININDSVIRTDDMNKVTILSQSAGKTQTLVLSKDTTLLLPEGAPKPSYENSYLISESSDVEYVFVKADENDGTETYILREKELATFIPKTSFTLYRDLILNVYIPNRTSLVGFTLDGKNSSEYEMTAVTLEGENYYLISIPLSAKEACRNIVLQANVKVGEKTATGTFTFGIIKYSEAVLARENDVEKTLVKDILSYVRAAYAYFDTADSESIEKIDAILGKNYDENNAPALEGSTAIPTVGLSYVTFVLDETPSMRFYLAPNASVEDYKFYIDDKEVKTVSGTKDGLTYVDIDTYAYAACETVTYTVNGEESSLHINAYYAYVTSDVYTADDKAELTTLVLRLWKYCQSARDYRASVVEK